MIYLTTYMKYTYKKFIYIYNFVATRFINAQCFELVLWKDALVRSQQGEEFSASKWDHFSQHRKELGIY